MEVLSKDFKSRLTGRSERELEPNVPSLLKNEDYLLKIGNMLDAIDEMEKSVKKD